MHQRTQKRKRYVDPYYIVFQFVRSVFRPPRTQRAVRRRATSSSVRPALHETTGLRHCASYARSAHSYSRSDGEMAARIADLHMRCPPGKAISAMLRIAPLPMFKSNWQHLSLNETPVQVGTPPKSGHNRRARCTVQYPDFV